MKFYYLSLLILLSTKVSFAQYKTVVYDYEKNFFNEGQPLPAENNFMLNGNLLPNTEIVSFNIYQKGSNKELFTTKWKKPFADKEIYSIPVNYKLEKNKSYDFSINYYRIITQKERDQISSSIEKTLLGLIHQNYELNKNSLTSFTNRNVLVNEMDNIVKQGLYFYENDLNYKFPGFSLVVIEKIKRIDKMNLKKSKFSTFLKNGKKANKFERNNEYFNHKLKELELLINIELTQYFNTVKYIIVESRTIKNYNTEKGNTVLPINFGYGAIYNEGSLSNLSYGHSPYVGASIPLKRNFNKSSFINNTSLSFGTYLNSFDDQNGNKIGGPITNTPLFIGLGTNVFKVFRLNIGATALQKNVNGNLNVDNVYFRPSININLELGLWLGMLK